MPLKRLKFFLFALALLILILPFGAALAGAFDTVSSGFADTGKEAGYELTGEGAPAQEFPQAFLNYVNGMILLTGALFLVLMIFAGYLWMTAFGKEEQVKRAKDLIIQALIGFAIIFTARLIVEIVISQLGETLK